MRRNVAANIPKMYAVNLLFNMYFISAILVPFYIEWGKLKFSDVLYINAAFQLFVFLLEIPTGTVADWLGRKASLLLAAVFSAAGVAVYVSYPSFWVFLLAEFIFAIGFSLKSGADSAVIYDSLKAAGKAKESKKVFARAESMSLLGIMLSAAAGGFLAEYFGYRAPFLAMSLTFAAAIAVIITLREPGRGRRLRQDYAGIMKDGVRFFAGHPVIRILVFDMVAVGGLAWLVIFFYQKVLLQLGFDIKWFGIMHAAMCGAEILAMKNFSALEAAFKGKKNLLVAGALIPGAALIVLGMASTGWVAVPAILIAAAFGLTRIPLFISYLNKYIPSGKRATVLSVANMFRTLVIALVNLAAGFASGLSVNNTLIISGILLFMIPLISRVEESHLKD